MIKVETNCVLQWKTWKHDHHHGNALMHEVKDTNSAPSLKHEQTDKVVVYTVIHDNRATRSRIPNRA